MTEAKYAGFRRLIFNVAKPPFDNVKLRRAVLYALDAKEFLKGAHWGFGEPASIWAIPKTSPWFVHDLPIIERDVNKVKQLLKETPFVAWFLKILTGPPEKGWVPSLKSGGPLR